MTNNDKSMVTSNAVYQAIGGFRFKFIRNIFTITNGYVNVNPYMSDNNYHAFVQKRYGDVKQQFFIAQEYTGTALYIYVRNKDGTLPEDGETVDLNILILY